MKNIHILPTDKPSRLIIQNGNKLILGNEEYSIIENRQHIYITSEEEIKEGDWILNEKFKDIYKITSKIECNVFNTDKYSHIKKIIITTDQELIKDGVQAIDDEFIEWFIKNPSCEFAHLGFTSIIGDLETKRTYKIIIPKEEPKQELHSMDDEVECNTCGNIMSLTEDESTYVCYNSECTSCYEEYEEEPKQETIEEAAERHHDTFPRDLSFAETRKESFIEGAKWQTKRMYSEEDIRIAFTEGFNARYKMQNGTESLKKFIEQFKKK